jgi:predicted RNA-binding Zn-ribbon protein involved in translation (DUF1610 family)
VTATLYAQGELFPTDVVHEPTIAERAGDSIVTQCARCGLLVCAAARFTLGPCPACSNSTWWRQDPNTGPFRRATERPARQHALKGHTFVPPRDAGPGPWRCLTCAVEVARIDLDDRRYGPCSRGDR